MNPARARNLFHPMRRSLHKRLNGGRGCSVKSAVIQSEALSPLYTFDRNRPGNAAFPALIGRSGLKEDFTIRAGCGRSGKSHRSGWAPTRARRVVDLLTRPNHLYISTNEIAGAAWRRAALPCVSVARQVRTRPRPGGHSCSPNRSSISPISAIWNC